MRLMFLPRPKTNCALKTSITAICPPKTSPNPDGLKMPRMVKSFLPCEVNRGNLSPSFNLCLSANVRAMRIESGWASARSGSPISLLASSN